MLRNAVFCGIHTRFLRSAPHARGTDLSAPLAWNLHFVARER
jgi:hypothetical protein